MQEQTDVIIIRGCPASGKSQTAKSLSKLFPKGVRMEVDTLRQMVISVDWENQQEHIDMLYASTKLVFEFLRLNFYPIIVVDTFSGDKINSFIENLYLMDNGLKIKIIGLYTTDKELINRLEKRTNQEFKDLTICKMINNDVLKWKKDNEFQINTTSLSPIQTAAKVFEHINS